MLSDFMSLKMCNFDWVYIAKKGTIHDLKYPYIPNYLYKLFRMINEESGTITAQGEPKKVL